MEDIMNIFKKLLNLFRKNKKEEHPNEAWYNNAHEDGEGMRNGWNIGAGGSPNAYEAHATDAAVRR